MADMFRSGDWNAICDRCGFKKKATELRDEWTGLKVCADCWEPQHPQDFVRATNDMVRIPWARPDRGNTFITTTLAASESKGDLVVKVADATGIAQYGTIGIETDRIVQVGSGVTDDLATSDAKAVFWTTVASVSGTDITINDELDYAAASGNNVYVMTNDEFLAVGDVTVAGDFKV